jgi:diguanylate cyclase (GGDEF)-like protein/PAS domain S-box-containing protein
MYLIVACGVVVCLLSVFRFPVAQIDLRFLILSVVTIVLGSRIGIEFSSHKIQITVSDTFVFLTLLLYGGEAAILVATTEAFCSSFRFSKLWLTRFFNSALLACSTFLTSVVVYFAFGSPVELTHELISPNFITAVCVIALTQYTANSGMAALRQSLKTAQPFLQTWKEHFLWASITYFAGAAAAGITAKLIIGNGFYAFVATIPIISIIYFTYQTYQKQIEAKTEQVEQAARHSEEQERISKELRHSEEHFRGAFDYAAVGMALVGTDGRWLRVNQSFCNLVGYSEKELLGMDLQSITHSDDLGNSLADMYRMVDQKVVNINAEKRYIHKQGHEVWTIISASAVADSSGKPMHFIMQAQDISERKHAEAKLHHAAFYDSLTALPNRALFTEHLQIAIKRTKQHKTHLYAVLFIDIDRFKNVNDSLGHVIGDQLLINVARRLEKCIRTNDIAARFGGDEFAVLLNGLKNPTDAVATAERIQEVLAQPFTLAGHDVFCGGSIGVAFSTLEYTQSEEILRDADTAMYRAKEQGKGRFEIFDKMMHSRAILRLQLENDLRKAIEREEFKVYYQPIVDMQTRIISGFEALVRWQHPERGIVFPADFIPLAEETELIIPIGNWVLLESCRQIREWQTKWNFPVPLTISINLSGKQFKQSDLVEQIKQILYQTKLDPQYLRLEITESTVMDNAESASAMLKQIRSLGVQLSIDDFGTGYSSLSYLHRFPVNILKIDRSFVNRMTIDEESLGIVETIIALAGKLKMKVVAEGVETEAQCEQLRKFNCEYAQGYLFSKPVTTREAKELIEKEWEQANVQLETATLKKEEIDATSENFVM